MNTPRRLQRIKEVAEALERGLPYREIANELGVLYDVVCKDVLYGRELGLIPPRKDPDPHVQITTKLKSMNLVKGTIGGCLIELADDERDWLFSSAKRVGYRTVAECFADLVRAAYDAEKGDGP